MDVRFLGEVAEAFIVKYSLYDHYNAKTLQDELYSLVKEVRETDIELYDHLYDTGRLQQQKILETYLGYQHLEGKDEEVIQEFGIELGLTHLAIGGITALLTIIYQNRINKAIFATGKNIGKVLEYIGTTLTRHGRYWKFRYAIVQQNAKKCYVACGIDEKNLSAWSYFSVGSKPPNLSTAESHRQGTCLKKCYIQFTIESIALLSKSYFACLKRSGDWADVKNARPDDILTVLSGMHISSLCQSYFDDMKKAMDTFTDLLDFVYGKSSPDKTKAMKELKTKVLAGRKEIDQARNMNQYK
jgi:hypothetical protein